MFLLSQLKDLVERERKPGRLVSICGFLFAIFENFGVLSTWRNHV